MHHKLFTLDNLDSTLEPEFVNLLRRPEIDSQPSGIDCLESLPGLLKFTNSGSEYLKTMKGP
jgi:hypothetical protein